MQENRLDLHSIDLTQEITFPGDISFDPEAMTIQGEYGDELSAYRARKVWADTLENCFLLDGDHDFTLSVRSNLTAGQFNLVCSFGSACARYAFWRLTNNQAPEAQYLLETAHIPASGSQQDNFVSAPDLRSAIEQSLDKQNGPSELRLSLGGSLRAILRNLLKPESD